jgi:hypothetical protein
VEIINKEHSKRTRSRKMSIQTNSEKFFTPPKSPKKSDVNRHARNSENNMLRCRHLSAIEDLMK